MKKHALETFVAVVLVPAVIILALTVMAHLFQR